MIDSRSPWVRRTGSLDTDSLGTDIVISNTVFEDSSP